MITSEKISYTLRCQGDYGLEFGSHPAGVRVWKHYNIFIGNIQWGILGKEPEHYDVIKGESYFGDSFLGRFKNRKDALKCIKAN